MYAALGIVLIIAGAILTFAIDRQADGVDIDAIGWILMAGGAVSLLVALFQAAAWTSWRKRHYVTERHVSPDPPGQRERQRRDTADGTSPSVHRWSRRLRVWSAPLAFGEHMFVCSRS
jgi:hypothetical protein